jgi:Bacterial TSP3 repeat
MRTYHTGPLNQDSDNDDISDGDEVKRYHTDPLVPNAKPPAQPPAPAPTPAAKDTDGDGLSDSDEQNVYRTDPNRKDTDRDGRDDGTEVKNGTNPRIPII